MTRIIEGAMLVKIAPGKKARFWDECRLGGYIRLGWDQLNVGDLRDCFSRDDLVATIKQSQYSQHPSTISKLANELWTIKTLQPGDQIVANKGRSEVLGLGTVVSPGYQWDGKRKEYRHRVSVEWYRFGPWSVPQQGSWRNTVVFVPPGLFRQISGIQVRNPIDRNELDEARGRTVGPAKQRPGQGKFRSRLMRIYAGRCAVTDCAVEETLQAAHIYTLSGKDENDPSNGVLLRADMHLLFDKLLWRIDCDGSDLRLALAPSLRKYPEYERFHGQPLRLPAGINTDRFRRYLQRRRRW